MKVAFFTDSWKPNKDGVVYSIESLIKNLPREGFEVSRIITPSPDGKGRKRKEMGLEVWELPSFPLPFYKQYRFGLIWKGGAKKALKGVDILHSHGVGATSLASVLAAKEMELPSVVTFHTNIMRATHYLGLLKGLGDTFTRNYLRYLYSKYDAVVAPSKRAAKELEAIGVKARVIPNGIDTSLFSGKGRNPAKRPLLIHVGRVVKEKNIDLIIDYFSFVRKEFPEAELWVIGDGPYLEELKKRDLEGVKLLGWVERNKLKEIYSKADALVFASLFDTQGLVVFEALASSLPVIAHEESSAAEFIKGCGKTFNDKLSFLEAVRQVMSEECKPNLKEIDERGTAKRYASLYREVAKITKGL